MANPNTQNNFNNSNHVGMKTNKESMIVFLLFFFALIGSCSLTDLSWVYGV
jgi:hypothetical protein